jgi:hypothetical protein
MNQMNHFYQMYQMKLMSLRIHLNLRYLIFLKYHLNLMFLKYQLNHLNLKFHLNLMCLINH